MKRFFCFLFAILLLLAAVFGCKKAEEPENTMQFGQTEEPAASDTANESMGSVSPAVQKGAAVEVTDTVAYWFDGVLYGAAAYQNIGDVPVVVEEAVFTFHMDGTTHTETFIPATGAYDVIAPGNTGYCVGFFEDTGLENSGTMELGAELKAVKASTDAFTLTVQNGYLIENYPGFATLSGELKNPDTQYQSCDLNMIFAGFYDAEDTLLGVWYFSKNAQLAPGMSIPFVVHMKALPVENLAENCSSIHFHAFGING